MTMTTISQSKTIAAATSNEARISQVLPKNWDFDKEDLCLEFYKAFERGENFQKKNAEEKLKKEINQLFERATFLSENIFNTITNDLKVDAKKMMLNISDLPNFQTIIFVPKNVFLSAKMLEIYKMAFALKSKFNDSTFRIDFRFIKDSETINHSLLESDGYILTYSNDGTAEKAIS